MKINFILSRLWQYLNIYFLKPFDAINDTLTSYIIFKNIKFKNNYVEIGSGDGMFSYIMHGGRFPLSFDRYLDIDFDKKNIFDVHSAKIQLKKKKFNNLIRPAVSFDSRKNHVKKILNIGFSKKAISTKLESIHLKKKTTNFIFFYTPHGINNLEKCIKSASKILKKKGKMAILVFDNYVNKNFISYRLGSNKNFISNFFKKIDNGRYNEISQYSKSPKEWEKVFKKNNLKILRVNSGLSGFAWKVYDIQTRPFLKILIRFFNFFPKIIRTILKFFWMLLLYPILLVFFILFSNLFFKDRLNCYHAYELLKIRK